MDTNIYPINQLQSIQNQSEHDSIEEEKEAERRRLQRKAIIFGGLSFAIVITLFIFVNSGYIVLSGEYQEKDLKQFSQKLEFALRYQALGLLLIASLIAFIAGKRFFSSAFDPTSNNEGIVQKSKNILQNSLEQFVLSSIAQLVLTTNLSAGNVMTIIPFMSFNFFFSRIIYFFTYPNYRAFAFLINFCPTLLAILYCAFNISI